MCSVVKACAWIVAPVLTSFTTSPGFRYPKHHTWMALVHTDGVKKHPYILTGIGIHALPYLNPRSKL